MVMNYSPLRGMVDGYTGGQNNIIAGVGRIEEIADSVGIKHYLSIAEYASLFQSTAGLNKGSETQNENTLLQGIQDRHGCALDTVRSRYETVQNLFVLNDPTYTEQLLQLLSNLLARQDSALSLYITNPDIIYKDSLDLPRFSGFGCFIEQVKRLVVTPANEHKLRFVQCGKPTLNTFQYTQQMLQQVYPEQFE